MAEQVDVCIVGSGFGGAITAYRLAELYRAAGADASSILVLERGKRFGHTDFKQSMHIDHLSDVYLLIQGQGAQVVTANAVGGGSNLYLAASLRSPSDTFERRDRRPGDGPERRMWPAAISRRTLDPYYARAEAGLRVRRPKWREVSNSGALWAAHLHSAGHTCDRVPLAINEHRCVDAKWCHTGCIFGAKNSLITNYLPSAERIGVRIRPETEVERVARASSPPYRYTVTLASGDTVDCKVLVMSAGAMGTPPILLRSRSDLSSLSPQVGRNLGSNGDHIAAIEYDPDRVRRVLGLPRYHQFYMGKPITTMSYDWWVGRRGNRFDGTRFTLQEIFLSTLTNFLYDDGRPPAGDPSWWGVQKKQAVAKWASRIELLAQVEDTQDGVFYAAPPSGDAERPNAGPVAVGTFTYALSEQSIRIREYANGVMAKLAAHRGLGRFMALTETQGAYVAHPLGGCRMAESADLGVTDDRGVVYGYEGLYCIDGSIIPTSLGVNPSLTIAAVSERCAEGLVAKAGDLGLPSARVTPRTPDEIVGPRVIP